MLHHIVEAFKHSASLISFSGFPYIKQVPQRNFMGSLGLGPYSGNHEIITVPYDKAIIKYYTQKKDDGILIGHVPQAWNTSV